MIFTHAASFGLSTARASERAILRLGAVTSAITNCCREAMPAILNQRYLVEYLSRMSFTTFSESSSPSNEDEATVRKMKEPKLEYFSAIDTKKRMNEEIQVKGIPHVIIMD